eukprot:9922496-Alexandrium_andersonii.AAC.1
MGHSVPKQGTADNVRELASECAAYGGWVSVDGALRAMYVPLMPVPPWDVSYDVWGMGPPLDSIGKDKKMHVRMV